MISDLRPPMTYMKACFLDDAVLQVIVVISSPPSQTHVLAHSRFLILRFAEDSLLFQGSSRTLSRIFFGLIILELGSAEKGPGGERWSEVLVRPNGRV